MESWWEHCTHCLAGGHELLFCALGPVQDGVTFSVDQHCIIKFSVKKKLKHAEILCELNTQYGEETPSHTNVNDCYSKFSKGCNKML
jgi:hypothetical protein